jgi:two-component system alkaline phosphatase synthesis response regulator PhoP
MKVLVVDDEPRIVAGVRKYFEQAGFDVLAASDGPGGLSMALAERPDLVVLDLMLPGMDGMDVCRELRRCGANRMCRLSCSPRASKKPIS